MNRVAIDCRVACGSRLGASARRGLGSHARTFQAGLVTRRQILGPTYTSVRE